MIAVIGDTHLPRGSRRLPEACLALLRESALILHVGDLMAASVLEELRELAPVEAVHGNMDEWPLREALPERLVVDAEGLRIGLVHDAGPAAGRAARLRAAFPGCDLVAYGHTHLPEVTLESGVWIVNPGSPTERRRAPAHTMALVRNGVPELVVL
jgi:putative phosphoesterase